MDLSLFPPVVIKHILKFLPLKCKLLNRRVSKDWKEILERELLLQEKLWLLGIDNEHVCHEEGHVLSEDDYIPLVPTNMIPELLKAVVSFCPGLKVVKIDKPVQGYQDTTTEEVYEWLLILSTCPLQCFEAPDTILRIPDFSRYPNFPHLKHLHLSICHNIFANPANFPAVDSLTGVFFSDDEEYNWSNLRSGVKIIVPGISARQLFQSQRLRFNPCSLETLSMAPAASTLEVIGPVNGYYVPHSRFPLFPRLKSISFYDHGMHIPPVSRGDIRLFLEAHAHSLQDINFLGFRLDNKAWRQILTSLPSIMSLGFDIRLSNPSEFILLLQELIPNLESLSLGLYTEYFILEHFVEAVTHNSFPQLKNLTIIFSNDPPYLIWKRKAILGMIRVAENMMTEGRLVRMTIQFPRNGVLSFEGRELTPTLLSRLSSLPPEIGVYGIDNNDRLVPNLSLGSKASFTEIGFRHKKRCSTMLLK